MNEALRDFLNDLLINFEDKDVLERLYYFVNVASEYLNKLEKLLYAEPVELNFNYMHISDTLNNVRLFLSILNKDYLEKFETSLCDGSFNLFSIYSYDDDSEYVDIIDDKEFDKLPKTYIDENNNISIDVPIKNTVQDGAIIIHEFFHYLNFPLTLERGELFTEFASIYMEFRYELFLIERGYDKNLFLMSAYDRIDETFNNANEVFLGGSIVDIYNKTGNINVSNINFISRYRKLYRTYKKDIKDFCIDEDSLEYADLFYSRLGYLIGTLVSFNLLKDYEANDSKVMYINDNMDKFNYDTFLKVFNMTGNDYKKWIDTCVCIVNQFIKESDSFEQDNGDIGSYRSR